MDNAFQRSHGVTVRKWVYLGLKAVIPPDCILQCRRIFETKDGQAILLHVTVKRMTRCKQERRQVEVLRFVSRIHILTP